MNALTNLTGDTTTFNPAAPAQQVTVGNVPLLNPNFARSFVLSSEVVRVSRGNFSACITNNDIAAALVAIEPGLTYPPIFTLQPVSAAVVATNPALFTVVASGEFDATYPVTYQWVFSIDQGQNYNNVTDGGDYSGATTDSLTVTPATVASNGYIFACVATNAAGSTNSAGAILTVT